MKRVFRSSATRVRAWLPMKRGRPASSCLLVLETTKGCRQIWPIKLRISSKSKQISITRYVHELLYKFQVKLLSNPHLSNARSKCFCREKNIVKKYVKLEGRKTLRKKMQDRAKLFFRNYINENIFMKVRARRKKCSSKSKVFFSKKEEKSVCFKKFVENDIFSFI